MLCINYICALYGVMKIKKSQNTEFLKTIKVYEKENQRTNICHCRFTILDNSCNLSIRVNPASIWIGNLCQNGNIVSFFKG